MCVYIHMHRDVDIDTGFLICCRWAAGWLKWLARVPRGLTACGLVGGADGGWHPSPCQIRRPWSL